MPAVSVEEGPDPRAAVGHLREVVPVEAFRVRAHGREPEQRVRDVVDARRGVQVVPVDQPDRTSVLPDEVPRPGVAVTPHHRLAAHRRRCERRVLGWLPIGGGVVHLAQQPGRGAQPQASSCWCRQASPGITRQVAERLGAVSSANGCGTDVTPVERR